MGPPLFFTLGREFAAQGCVLQGFLGSGAIQGALWVLPAEGLEREIRDYLCLFLSSEVTGPLYKRPACSSIPAEAEATSGPACWRDCPSGISPHTASPPYLKEVTITASAGGGPVRSVPSLCLGSGSLPFPQDPGSGLHADLLASSPNAHTPSLRGQPGLQNCCRLCHQTCVGSNPVLQFTL